MKKIILDLRGQLIKMNTQGFSAEWDKCYLDNTQLSIWPWTDLVSLVHRNCKHLIASGNSSMMEFGCGAGANIPLFLQLGMKYFAVEGSPSIVKRLHLRFPELVNQIVAGDFTLEVPFTSNFDLVVDRAAITHNSTDAIKRTLKNIYCLLNSGGIFIGVDWFSTRHSDYLGGEQANDEYTRTNYCEGQFIGVGNVHFSNEAHLRELFADFEILVLDEKIITEHQSGSEHIFSSWNIVVRKT